MRIKRGFTLIELLVVIAIIVLLMSILLPVTQRVRNQARAVVCQANLRQWGTVFHMYTEENQGRFIFNNREIILFLRGSFLRNDEPNMPPVINDMNTHGIALCPMAAKPGPSNSVISIQLGPSPSYIARGTNGSTFEAWTLTNLSPTFLCSYGINSRLDYPTTDIMTLYLGKDIYSIQGRANFPLLLDSSFPNPLGLGRNPPSTGFHFCINRHNGHVNSLFLDFSVRKIGLKELWTLKWYEDFNTSGPWTKAGGVQPEDWPDWMRGFKDY